MEDAPPRRQIPPPQIKRRHEVTRLEPDIIKSVYAAILPPVVWERPRPQDRSKHRPCAETHRRVG